MDSMMELYEELIHTQTKTKNKKKQPDLELQKDQNSFQEIKIGEKIITNEKHDESIIEDMSTYLPLSQRIKNKFGISSETIFKK